MGEGTEKKSEEKALTEEATEQKKENTVPTMFSSATVISKDAEKKEPFSFGVSQSGFGNLSSGFGSGTGFSFGSLNSKKDSEPENGETEVGKDGDEEEEEAVKVEEKAEEAVVEEDALFSKKCKLFYKKEVQKGIAKSVIDTQMKFSGFLYGKRLGKHPSETDSREESSSKIYSE